MQYQQNGQGNKLKEKEYAKHSITGEIKIREKMELILDPWVLSSEEEYDAYIEKENKKRMEGLNQSFECPHLKIDNYLENTQRFYATQPFFYDRAGIFWFWDKAESKYRIVDDVDLMLAIDNNLQFYGQTITKGVKGNYLEAFKRVGRLHTPKDAPKKMIQFKDKAFSISSGKMWTVTPDFFFTNPIPYEIGESSETPILDKLFTEWVGEKNKDMLYEIIAYCCYTDYPVQVLFSLVGIGRNGKSTFLKILSNFIGTDNICSSELDLLSISSGSRFETAKLYKRLVCIMGETNFGVIDKSSIIKKLTGGDLIGFELKNKTPFNGYNYAKILIASNSLPTSDDTSEGFYRRWVIIDFPNTFPEGNDISLSISKKEYQNLAKKITIILPELLKRGSFLNQGSIEERKERYIMASNPLPKFISDCCKVDGAEYVRFSELYTHYVAYLQNKNRRVISKKEFSKLLSLDGFEVRRTSKKNDLGDFINDSWIEGLCFVNNVNVMQKFSTLSRGMKKEYEILAQRSHSSQKVPEEEILPLSWDDRSLVWHKCSIEGCSETPCNYDSYNILYCKKHYEEMAR